MSALPPSGRRVPPPLRALPLIHRSYGLMRPSPLALLSFGLLPRSRSLCRLRSAPAAGGMFPTLSLRIYLRMPDPMPRRFHEVHLPVSSFVSSAFPKSREGRLPASNPRTRLFADRLFEAADIPLCSGLQICSPPRSFPPLRIQPQGGRGFDIRAERASLPPHAPDLLTVRIQAIDGTRTFTSPDSQPCRLLPASCRFIQAHKHPHNTQSASVNRPSTERSVGHSKADCTAKRSTLFPPPRPNFSLNAEFPYDV
jgi:hypothetical protein